jgi:hypothetical protein
MARTRTRRPELARSGPAELADAHQHLQHLITSAAAVHAAAAHDPDIAVCEDAACRLPEVGDGAALCALADRLADLHPGPPPERTDLALAVARFRRALIASLDAVRACRQTAHPTGRCWFAAVPGVDGCGEVLQAAHRNC